MGAMAMVHGGEPNMILLPKIVSALQMADRALSGEHTEGVVFWVSYGYFGMFTARTVGVGTPRKF